MKNKWLPCKHYRLARYFPNSEETFLFLGKENMGKFDYLVLDCCLDCGKIKVRNFGE